MKLYLQSRQVRNGIQRDSFRQLRSRTTKSTEKIDVQAYSRQDKRLPMQQYGAGVKTLSDTYSLYLTNSTAIKQETE